MDIYKRGKDYGDSSLFEFMWSVEEYQKKGF